ncbi:MAG TPA: hypothetical protein VJA16_12690 [Thermoanaerobaculia bacterium]
MRLADGILAACEADYERFRNWFGVTPAGLPFEVYLVGGDFGAKHATCAATKMTCAAFDGHDVNLVRMLVAAEEVEVFSAALNGGWNCATSSGEGLSRVLAAETVPNGISGFATAACWLDTPDRPDFVSCNYPNDAHLVSIGCSTLFLNYLRYQLGFSWTEIIRKGGSTLASTYHRLANRMDAFGPFATLLESFFPPGARALLLSDNPFPLPLDANAKRRAPMTLASV